MTQGRASFSFPIRRLCIAIAAVLALCISAGPADAQDRFPRPDFRSDYNTPSLEVPLQAESFFEYIDLGFLAMMLLLVSFFALKVRSRNAIMLCSVISLVYFGFIRQGCICPVGSIQNVALSFAESAYSIPVFAAGFFLLPLVTSLFFGRTFCAGVCPLGAIQDLVAFRPVRVPRSIDRALSFFPWVYLGIAVLSVFSGLGFLICRFDPFVEIFRFGSSLPVLIWGGALLVIGVFIARPYCRYLCPYGALLGLFSRVSYRHLTITPAECVKCRLCEESCPVQAIIPAADQGLLAGSGQSEKPRVSRKRLLLTLAFLPVITAACAFAGMLLPGFLGFLHRDIQVAREISLPGRENRELSEEARFFEETGLPIPELQAKAAAQESALPIGSPVTGAFIGLVAGLFLIGLSIPRKNRDYIPDRASCVSCGRCIEYCPIEHSLRNKRKPGMFKGFLFPGTGKE